MLYNPAQQCAARLDPSGLRTSKAAQLGQTQQKHTSLGNPWHPHSEQTQTTHCSSAVTRTQHLACKREPGAAREPPPALTFPLLAFPRAAGGHGGVSRQPGRPAAAGKDGPRALPYQRRRRHVREFCARRAPPFLPAARRLPRAKIAGEAKRSGWGFLPIKGRGRRSREEMLNKALKRVFIPSGEGGGVRGKG